MKTFRTGGYYVSDMNDKTILLGLNTILYYRNNHYKMSIANDPAGQFAFMRKQLDAARDGNKTAHIIAHIPPGGESFIVKMREEYIKNIDTLEIWYREMNSRSVVTKGL